MHTAVRIYYIYIYIHQAELALYEPERHVLKLHPLWRKTRTPRHLEHLPPRQAEEAGWWKTGGSMTREVKTTAERT